MSPLSTEIKEFTNLSLVISRVTSSSYKFSVQGSDMGITDIQVAVRDQKDPLSLAVDGVFVYQNGSKPITDFVGEQVQYS